MWPDENGDWGLPSWDSTGTTAYQSPTIQNPDIVSSTAAPAAGQDRWSGFFQSILGNVTSYAISKDAAKSGIVQARAANGTPIYTAAGTPVYQPQSAAGNGSLLLIGLAAVAGLLLLKKG